MFKNAISRGCRSASGAACGPKPPADPPRPPSSDLPARVVWDFEHAVLQSQDAMVALFDFTAVGQFEILLHRYDALGWVGAGDQAP